MRCLCVILSRLLIIIMHFMRRYYTEYSPTMNRCNRVKALNWESECLKLCAEATHFIVYCFLTFYYACRLVDTYQRNMCMRFCFTLLWYGWMCVYVFIFKLGLSGTRQKFPWAIVMFDLIISSKDLLYSLKYVIEIKYHYFVLNNNEDDSKYLVCLTEI